MDWWQGLHCAVAKEWVISWQIIAATISNSWKYFLRTATAFQIKRVACNDALLHIYLPQFYNR
jgi:hypothetical protein